MLNIFFLIIWNDSLRVKLCFFLISVNLTALINLRVVHRAERHARKPTDPRRLTRNESKWISRSARFVISPRKMFVSGLA